MKRVVPMLAMSWLLVGGASFAVRATAQTAVSGVVRDVHGTPQLGALVELLGPDATIISRAFTDDHGRYVLRAILPGNYQLRASAAFLMPTLRPNLRLKDGVHAVADLTMTAIFEAGAWLPTERRTAAEPSDDWRWTLRSTANRPLLRLAGDSAQPSGGETSSSAERNGRAVSGGQIAFISGDGNFGEGGNRQVVTLGRAAVGGDVSILKADLGNSNPGVGNSVVLGASLEHARAWGGGTRVFVGFASHPELRTGTSAGLQVLNTATTEKIAVGDTVMIDAGTLFTAEHLLGTRFSSAPYVRVAFKATPELSLEYHLATDRSLQRSEDLDDVSVPEEVLTDRAGSPVFLKGLHQEIAAVRTDEKRVVSVAVYHDSSAPERIQGGGALSQESLAELPVVYDPTTETLRFGAEGAASYGVRVAWTESITPMLSACVDAEVGSALRLHRRPEHFSEVSDQLHSEAAAGISGKLQMRAKRTGTLLDIKYRWQPSETLTQVDEYDVSPEDAFLGVSFRQKLWAGRRLKGLNAVVEATNLLSQGYEPILGSDGQTLFLAQMPRALQGGLAFTF